MPAKSVPTKTAVNREKTSKIQAEEAAKKKPARQTKKLAPTTHDVTRYDDREKPKTPKEDEDGIPYDNGGVDQLSMFPDATKAPVDGEH